MRKLFIILILLTFSITAYAHTFYKWMDEEGVVNFTDDYSNVPPSYRDRVEVREYITEGGSPAHALEVPPQKTVEVKTDIYGRDEGWWRDKVHPWRERLKEATENYESAQRNFLKKAEELSQTNFYGRSRSQTKWDVMGLNRFNEERKKYGTQIAEANKLLSKLSKEAMETKADLAWLE